MTTPVSTTTPHSAKDVTGHEVTPPTLVCRGRKLATDRPLIMAVVNATPDSFSDRERLETTEARASHCFALLDAGADILDLGGQSGITGVPEITEDEEAARVVPLVKAVLTERPDTVVSVDTYRPRVTAEVIAAGAAIINDVSGLAYPEVSDLCADAGCGLVIMHTRVAPKQKRLDPDLYDDVTGDVITMLREQIGHATERGIPLESIIVDPGIDYAKTPYQSVQVIREQSRVVGLERPVLWALSRKDFIGAITGQAPADRLAGTLGAIGYIRQRAGAIFRVHDVADVAAYLLVQRALQDGDVLTAQTQLPRNKRREQ